MLSGHGFDRLARRAELQRSFPALPLAWDRIIELEAEASALRLAVIEARGTHHPPACQFPEHRDHYGRVTHMRSLPVAGLEDDYLVMCEVCRSVSCEPLVAIALAAPLSHDHTEGVNAARAARAAVGTFEDGVYRAPQRPQHSLSSLERPFPGTSE